MKSEKRKQRVDMIIEMGGSLLVLVGSIAFYLIIINYCI